jgi:chromate reductase
MTAPKLLGIPGALRAASSNRMLMHEAFRLFGAAETRVGDIRMPLYDEDAEDAEGLPAEAQALVEACRWADAIVIATPEYNKSVPGVLKNALDWISRARPGCLRDKPLAMMSASDGQYGGERAQVALRQTLVPFRPVIVNGPEVLVSWSRGETAFDGAGRLVQERPLKALGELMRMLRAAAGGT